MRRVVAGSLHRVGGTGEADLSVVITDAESVWELNRRFRGVEAPTDVLAFGFGEGADHFVAAPGSRSYLGDVIVSYSRAVAQAEEQGHAVTQELNLLIVHGLLHLLGYDHADEDGRAEMWARQEEILGGLAAGGPPGE